MRGFIRRTNTRRRSTCTLVTFVHFDDATINFGIDPKPFRWDVSRIVNALLPN